MVIKIKKISFEIDCLTDSQLNSILQLHPEMVEYYNEEDLIAKEVDEQYKNLRVFDIIHEKFDTINSKTPGKKTQFIRDNLPILKVANQYGLKIKHNKCICPFHVDTDPSLVFFPKTNSFYCYGERKGGDVIEFIRKMEEIKNG